MKLRPFVFRVVALEIIHKELNFTMAFCGKTDINTVDQGILLPGTFPTA
jgi:L-lactate dehydrogenase (cytochrome)